MKEVIIFLLRNLGTLEIWRGKASGTFLRARVALEIAKPLRRGILHQVDRLKEPEWFDVQYEKLPFFCFSCGIMRHTEIECDKPAQRNAFGEASV